MQAPVMQALLKDGALAGEWALDPRASSVQLKSKIYGLVPVNGVFREVGGNGTVSPDGQGSGTLTIAAASIDTKNTRRDTHLRSADFFEVNTYPTLTFRSTGIKTDGDNEYDLVGDLTIHGVTRRVSFDATFLGKAKDPWGNDRIAFEAETTLPRKDFGLHWNAALETGGFLVGDDVKISLSLQAVPQKG